jgi:hypothetical protein
VAAVPSRNLPPPVLSVVIVWREPSEDVEECLRSLVGQVQAAGGEVVVVTALSEQHILAARGVVPGPRWVRISRPLTEPRAWEAGFATARGATVAFGHARCRYAPGWANAACAANVGVGTVATGPVALVKGTPLSGRATYLCDYASFADPAGPSDARASSNNIAFARQALLALSTDRSLDKAALMTLGRFRVTWVPGMRVATRPVAPIWTDRLTRFHRGRHFAAFRASDWSKAVRLVAGLACFALPALLYVRLIGNRHLRSRFAGTLALGLPWIASALAAWSIGEMTGYWCGPGSSDRFL